MNAAAFAFVTRMRRTLRGRNVLLNLFEMWVGLAGIISGVVFLYDPSSIHQNAISQRLGYTASAAWVITYMLAGIAIWYGLLRPSPKWETAALWILGGATMIEGIAILSIFGLRGVASASLLLALTVAAWVRAVLVQMAALEFAHAHEERRRDARD